MKREILCPECEKKMRELFPVESPYPGEHVKFINGKAKFYMICDSCSNEISKGDFACAFSAYADYGGVPYHPWEEEYIEYDERTDCDCKKGN